MIHKHAGQSLVELLVAIGMMAILLPALYAGLISSTQGKAQQSQRAQAVTMIKETQEAVRSVRENGWTIFAINGTYHPVISGSTWSLVSGADTVNGFTRQLVIADVSRDGNGNIVSSGGTIDPSTKNVTTTVSWTQPYASSMQSVMYLTRYKDNLTHVDTTVADFTATGATLSGTTVTNTSGGEVVLGAGGTSDWCNPVVDTNTLDLPGQAIASGLSALPGHAYVTTGGNSSGDTIDSVSISDPPSPTPPVPSNGSVYNNFKGYAIFATANNAFVTSDHPKLTVDVVNTSNMTQVATFDASGKGNSVFVSGNIGYVTVGSTLYTFDVSNLSGKLSQLGSVNLAGTGNRVVVVGNYAYVAVGTNPGQLQVVQVSNGGQGLSIVSSTSVNGQQAQDVAVNNSGTRVYLVTGYNSSQSEFFIIDSTSKSGSMPILGSYNTSGMSPTGVVIVPGNKAIVVGSGGQQYQVINTVSDSAPIKCGGVSPSGITKINAVSAVTESDGDVYSYILTDNASAEFQIIAGGPGGQYATSGTYTSAPFNPGYQTAFNRFTATVSQPIHTTITMQVASSGLDGQGGCTNSAYAFVGPDGTSSTNYIATGSAISGVIPLKTSGNYQNPGRCFKYQASLSTTDNSQTPTLYDMTINYSP